MGMGEGVDVRMELVDTDVSISLPKASFRPITVLGGERERGKVKFLVNTPTGLHSLLLSNNSFLVYFKSLTRTYKRNDT